MGVASTGDGGGDSDAATSQDASSGQFAARKLRQLLIGRFDTAAQATRDMRYFDVTLAVCPVTVRALGTALYVEQALRGRAPYRQRVYVLTSGADPAVEAASKVYELSDPAGAVGLCDRADVQEFAVEDLVEREGCTVNMRWGGESFRGATTGRTCLSTLMGASYATTEITLGETTLDSWDRGYNAEGRQVWGATAGAYRFERRSALVALE
jgi:CpeT protein